MFRTIFDKLSCVITILLFLSVACSGAPVLTKQEQTSNASPSPVISDELKIITPDNVDSLEKIHVIGGSTLFDVAWDPHGEWLAISDSGQGIKLYDPETLQPIRELPGSATSSPGVMAVSPDGKYLVITPDGDTDIVIWNTETWEPLYMLDENLGPVNEIVFSPNSTLLAYISNAAGAVSRNDPDHPGFDGGNNIFLIDPASGKLTHMLRGGSSDIKSIAFSPDGKVLASGSCCGFSESDDVVQVWDTATGDLIHDFGPSSFSNGNALAVSPDGQYILSSNINGAYDLTTYEQSYSHHDYIDAYRIAFSPDGKWEAISYWETIVIREIANPDNTVSFDTNQPATRVAFSPDGKSLAYVIDGEVGIWQLDQQPPLIKTLQNVDGKNFALAPDDKMLAIAGSNGELLLLDIEADQSSSLSPGAQIQKIQFSESGDVLLVGRSDNSIEFWNVGTAQLIASIKDISSIEHLHFAGRSRVIASDSSGAFTVVSASDGKKLIEGKAGILPFANYFLSRDGRYIVVREIDIDSFTDTRLTIYDLETGNELKTITIPELVSAFALTPDIKTLIFSTASPENFAGDIVFYDLDRDQEIQRQPLGPAPAQMIVFDEGKSLAVVGDATSVWDIPGRSLRFRASDSIYEEDLKVLDERYLLGNSTLMDTWTEKSIYEDRITISTQKNLIATTQGNTVLLRDLNTGEELTRLTVHNDSVSNLVLSSGGGLLISGSENAGEIKLWNIERAGQAPAFNNNHVSPGAVAFSPDHSTLIYSENDRLKFMDLKNSTVFQTLEAQLLCSGSLQFPPGFGSSPGGNYFVTFDPEWRKLLVWESNTNKLLYSINVAIDLNTGENVLEAIAFSSDGNRLAMISNGKLSLTDLATGSVRRESDLDVGQAYLMTISPDDQTLTIVDTYGQVSICSLDDCSKTTEIRIADGNAQPVALTRDGKWLAVIVDDKELQVWNLESNTLTWSYQDPDIHYVARPERFVFSPDGGLLVFPAKEWGLGVWETATGKNVFTLDELDDDVKSMAFSQDGMLFATATENSIITWGIK